VIGKVVAVADDSSPHIYASMTEKPIELDQFLKKQRMAASGGHAKVLIQSGQVKVNGEVETRRGRKLQPGDVVEAEGKTAVVEESE
jgi:ribosome-associated protein